MLPCCHMHSASLLQGKIHYNSAALGGTAYYMYLWTKVSFNVHGYTCIYLIPFLDTSTYEHL